MAPERLLAPPRDRHILHHVQVDGDPPRTSQPVILPCAVAPSYLGASQRNVHIAHLLIRQPSRPLPTFGNESRCAGPPCRLGRFRLLWYRLPASKYQVGKARSSLNIRHEGIYFARSTAIRSSVGECTSGALAPIGSNKPSGARRRCDSLQRPQAKDLRSRASQVSEFTNIANVTPFLLPYRNFNSPRYGEMVERLYDNLKC